MVGLRWAEGEGKEAEMGEAVFNERVLLVSRATPGQVGAVRRSKGQPRQGRSEGVPDNLTDRHCFHRQARGAMIVFLSTFHPPLL